MADKRKIIELLPQHLQGNDQLSKFFNATVDQLFQPGTKKKLTGYVGKVPSYFDPTTDFYVSEPTSERQFYQLEPNMLSKKDGDITQLLNYPNLVNHLRFQGANVDDHNRLFKQEYYSWAPPIDIDKFLNFTNYYWYPEGPGPLLLDGDIFNIVDINLDLIGQKTYITADDVTLSNGMKVIFGTNVTPSSYQSTSWIIDGIGQSIRLIDVNLLDPSQTEIEYTDDEQDYITISRGAIDTNPWSRTNHWYHKNILAFLNVDNTQIETVNAVFWDNDPWDSTPWDAEIATLSPLYDLDPARRARRPILEFNYDLELYNYSRFGIRNVDIVDEYITNFVTEIETLTVGTALPNGTQLTVGQKIIFFNDVNNPNKIYTIDSSGGLYSLVLDKTGENNDGSPAIYEKIFNVGIEYYYDGTSYVNAQSKTKINQEPLFNLYDTNGDYLGDTNIFPENTFTGNTIFSYKRADSYNVNDIELGFPVSYKNFQQIAEIEFENCLQNKRISYETTPLIREEIKGFYYYKSSTEFSNAWNLSDDESTQELTNGFYEIPLNLKANADNEEVVSASTSELLSHFRSIILNQDDNTIDNYTETNYRNSAKDLGKGNVIVQNEASMLKLMLMASDERYDYNLAINYVDNEYTRFRNKVVNKATMLLNANPDTNINALLDDTIVQINASKKNISLFPFNNSRTIPHGNDYETITYQVAGTTFALPSAVTFDQSALGTYDAVSVYLNDTLLLINYDYTIINDDVELTTGILITDKLEIRHYADIRGSFLPATGAMMNLTSVYKPKYYTDYTLEDGVAAIQCHDGSMFAKTGTSLDDIIFELEKRIYNTIYEKFKNDPAELFSAAEVRPGYFREGNYSKEDYNDVITPIFTTWAVHKNLNWTDNNEDILYDQGNWKTWNWSGVKNTDGDDLSGSWVAIYNYYFDTPSPHLTPWEMLGFTEKPSWWDSEYTSNYSSTNTAMWQDLEDGNIRSGTRNGIHDHFKRPGMSAYIPVNATGDLLSPENTGITDNVPTVVSGQLNWAPGDMSPVEIQFWKSYSRSFVISKLYYLLKPAKWVETKWNTEDIDRATINTNQVINTIFNLRPKHSALIVDLEQNNDDIVTKTGIQQWLSNRLQFNGIDIQTTLGDDIRELQVSLAWNTAGFIHNQNLTFKADSYSPGSSATTQSIFVRDDDIFLELHKSNSINEIFYSGLLIEYTGTGYKVVGYDSLHPYFKIIPSDRTSTSTSISIGSATVFKYKEVENVEEEIPYGYEFTSQAELFDFMIAYERHLTWSGFIFEEYNSVNNEIVDWTAAGKDFVAWSNSELTIGSFLTISPLAGKVSFISTHGQVQDVEQLIRGTYAVLNRNATPIDPNNTTVFRNDDLFEISTTDVNGIFGLRLSIKEYENVVILNNTTRFNDIIYSPLFNLRHNRLKVFGHISDNWNGRVEANGYILDQSSSDIKLVPNFETLASDFRNYFDIENPSVDDTITDIARHQIGYQKRNYLENLLIDRDTQYQFYQGFLQQKGSRNTLSRLMRSSAISTENSVEFFEEWALRVNQYGATDIQKYFEIRLRSSEIKHDPQIIRFVKGASGDLDTDSIIDILPNDERNIISNSSDIDKFVARPSAEYYKKDLPNAGYVSLNETTYLAAYVETILDETEDVFNALPGETIWIAKDKSGYHNNTWDVVVVNDNMHYVINDEFDTQIIRVYNRDQFVQDGTTISFTVIPDIALNDNPDLIVAKTLTGIDLAINSVSNDTVTFIDAPTEDFYIYHPADTSTLGDILFFDNDSSRVNGIVDTFNDDGSVTMLIIGDTVMDTLEEFSKVYEIESLRIPSIIELPAKANTYQNGFIYVDEPTGWEVYKVINTNTTQIRSEIDLIDTGKIDNAIIYDEFKDVIVSRLTIFDPFKGLIPGIADAEISYKLEFDPARYGENERTWGTIQEGKIWWDTSTVSYLYYEMNSLDYKYQNWGKTFPGTSIDIYEWVRSPVPPADWGDFVTKSASNFNFTFGGTVKDIDSDNGPKWLETIELDIPYYYFWVKDSPKVPNKDFRSMSALDIKNTIDSPQDAGVKWTSPISTNTFLVGNIEHDLNDEDTIIQYNYTKLSSDAPIHTQWELLSEGDELSYITDIHWNKMRDSLVGFDALGKEVPDIKLKGNARYGHMIRPRQTWFKEKLMARQVFIQAINNTLKDINVVYTIPTYSDTLFDEDALIVPATIVTGTATNPIINPGDQISINSAVITLSAINGSSGIADDINANLSVLYAEYVNNVIQIVDPEGNDISIIDVTGTPSVVMGLSNYTEGEGPDITVATRTERNSASSYALGTTVIITNDEKFRDYWTYWTYLGGTISDENSWELIKIQTYRTASYWNYIDWYSEGYDKNIVVDATYATIADRNSTTIVEGTLIKVIDDGGGTWSWYLKTDISWTTVAREAASIEFSDTLYNSKSGEYGFDEQLFDVLPFDDAPQLEFKIIIDAIRNDIYIDSLLILQNELFFKMINHVHTESSIVDWIFKTSYLFISGFTDILKQTPIYNFNGFDEMVTYINEIKPYHTKIKDVIRTYATATDSASLSVIDYDNPVYEGRILDVSDGNDSSALNTLPWANWLSEYTKEDNKVRKLNTRIAFDRISSIRDGFTYPYEFVSHQDYPDKYAPTPYYNTTVGSSESKTTLNVPLLDNYVGTQNSILTNIANDGYNFYWDLNNNLVDTGNNNNNLVLTGTETYDDSLFTTTPDNSFVFDGATYLTAPSHPEINTVNIINKRSMTFAFNASSVHATMPQVLYAQGDTTRGYNITLFDDGNGLMIYGTIYNGTNKDVVSTPILLNTTYLVTYQFDVDGNAELYLNGNLVDTTVVDSTYIVITVGDAEFGGTTTDIDGPTALPIIAGGSSYYQGKMQYLAYYTEKFLTSDEIDDIWISINYSQIVQNVRKTPYIGQYKINVTGTLTGAIQLEGNAFPDFSGPTVIIAIYTDTGSHDLLYSEISSNPFLRVNVSAVAYGDDVDLTLVLNYENSLSRALDFYAPTVGMESLSDVITTHYLGTIIDGLTLNLDAGWDASPWDLANWDTATIIDVFDTMYDGGSYVTFVGDNSTGTYPLPAGTAPWFVATHNVAGDYIKELVETTEYTIVGTDIVLVAGTSWMTGANLATGFSLSILDSTYTSDQYVNGYNITQPDVEGWPEELAAMKINDSIVANVTSQPNLSQTLLNSVTEITTGSSTPMYGEHPLFAIFSGINGDTVILEGSDSGAFAGEEVIIRTSTANETITIPDTTNGYVTYAFYRARLTVYGSGSVSVVINMVQPPYMSVVERLYTTAVAYPYGDNINTVDDSLISANGVFLAHTSDYTVNTSDNTFTFVAPPDPNIIVTSWNTSGTSVASPTWVTQTYTAAAIDLSAINVQPGPTEPRENSMLVFGDTGSGFRRLTPPESRYFIANGYTTIYELIRDKTGYVDNDITVWINNVLQASGYTLVGDVGGDYITFTTAPTLGDRIAIRITGNEDYTINPVNDTLTVTAGMTLTTDTIAFYSFRTDDSSLKIQTQVFDGVTNLKVYQLDQIPENEQKVIVTAFVNGGIIGGIQLSPSQYNLVDNILYLDDSYISADKIVITSITGNEITTAPTEYKELVGYDNNKIYRRYMKVTPEIKTITTSTINIHETSIPVANAFICPVDGGYVWVGDELVEYQSRTGGASDGDPGTLFGLSRGLKGTRKLLVHIIGTVVISVYNYIDIEHLDGLPKIILTKPNLSALALLSNELSVSDLIIDVEPVAKVQVYPSAAPQAGPDSKITWLAENYDDALIAGEQWFDVSVDAEDFTVPTGVNLVSVAFMGRLNQTVLEGTDFIFEIKKNGLTEIIHTFYNQQWGPIEVSGVFEVIPGDTINITMSSEHQEFALQETPEFNPTYTTFTILGYK